MNYTEDSDPLVIEKVFHMSKSAFKRAIGHLYKEEKIIFLPMIHLCPKEANTKTDEITSCELY